MLTTEEGACGRELWRTCRWCKVSATWLNQSIFSWTRTPSMSLSEECSLSVLRAALLGACEEESSSHSCGKQSESSPLSVGMGSSVLVGPGFVASPSVLAGLRVQRPNRLEWQGSQVELGERVAVPLGEADNLAVSRWVFQR